MNKEDMLTLKEAGRYSNFLRDKIDEVLNMPYGSFRGQMIKTVEHHKKSESFKDAVNEDKEVEYEDEIDITVDELDAILELLVKEKAMLAEQIAEGKKKLKVEADGEVKNLDASIEYAKLLRHIASGYYRHFINKKEGKYKDEGQAYGVNVEGNQISYIYEIEREVTLKYNKDEYVKKNKAIKKKADRISEAVEKAMIEKSIKFVPKFSYLDSIEDMIELLRNDKLRD